MRNARRSGVDAISNLPCNVLDRILGCLPLKDAVKTSGLSKDWRYKWVTRQELEFDDNFFNSIADDQEAKKIIYQVLLLHQGPIMKFRLQSHDFRICPDINHWILFLSKKNVQEFTLDLRSNNRQYVPSHLFTFHKLRHLELYHCYFNPPITSFKGFHRLVNLVFHGVTFVPAISRNIISMCPLLERLALRWCTGFDILEIDATNLKCFEFRGKSKFICFKNAPMLGKVDVSLYPDSSVLTDASPVCFNFMEFFHYIPSLKELHIGGCFLQYLTMGGVPESPLTALNNVKTLSILRVFRNVEVFLGAFYLITSCPKLQELTIKCNSNNNVEPIEQFLRAQSVTYGCLKLLQRVKLNMFSGYKMDMEFVRFILASAPVLEKIYVWNYDPLMVLPRERMMDEVKQFRRASPNVEFIVRKVEVEPVDDRVFFGLF